MAAVYIARPSPEMGGVMPVDPPSESGSAAGSGIQFHCPATSVPDVTTDPATSCGVPSLSVAFGQSHSAHFTGSVDCPVGQTHHQ